MALEHPLNQTIYLEEAKAVAEELIAFAKGNQSADNAITGSTAANVEDPGKTFAGRLYQASQRSSQAQVATELGVSYHQVAWGKTLSVSRLHQHGTVNTNFDVRCDSKGNQGGSVDESDQFLKLSIDEHVEYVKTLI